MVLGAMYAQPSRIKQAAELAALLREDPQEPRTLIQIFALLRFFFHVVGLS